MGREQHATWADDDPSQLLRASSPFKQTGDWYKNLFISPASHDDRSSGPPFGNNDPKDTALVPLEEAPSESTQVDADSPIRLSAWRTI